MSRTFRKKYNPLRSKESIDMIERAKQSSVYYAENGHDVDGCRWFTTHYAHKSGCAYIRFDKKISRDGTRAHADIDAMLNIAVKRINSKVREKLRQELRRMRSGAIGWDENVEQVNKIRMHERSFVCYDLS